MDSTFSIIIYLLLTIISTYVSYLYFKEKKYGQMALELIIAAMWLTVALLYITWFFKKFLL